MDTGPMPVTGEENQDLEARLASVMADLSKSEARIAQFLQLSGIDILGETGASLAQKTGVSEITVSRFLRRLGYQGMSALKEEMRANSLADRLAVRDRHLRLVGGSLGSCLTAEAEAILGLARELARPEWADAVAGIDAATEVYVTGFQTIRGLAEDFARRLAIVRPRVRFLSAHDSGLAEWISAAGEARASRALVLVDIVPYAHEAEALARLCARHGDGLIVITDETNRWAYDHTPWVFHAATKVGTFLESTGPLASLLNYLIHDLARRNPEATRARMDAWPELIRDLAIY